MNIEFDGDGEEVDAGLDGNGGGGGDGGGDDCEGCLRFSDIVLGVISSCHELVISSGRSPDRLL